MKTLLTGAFGFLMVIALSTQNSIAQQPTGKGGLHIVGSSEVAAILAAGNAKERVTGRVSFDLVTSGGDAPRDQVRIRGFNIAFFGVPQRLIAGSAPVQEPLGMLGFAVSPGKAPALRYDPQRGQITGELPMYADASFLNAFAEPARDGKNDLFDTPTLVATATIRIDLEKPLGDSTDEAKRLFATMDIQLRTRGLRFRNYDYPSFEIRLTERFRVPVEIAPILFFEIARKLCIQPIRLFRFQFRGFPFPNIFFQMTGEGLPFGEPGARTEWRKADVLFEIRDWKTLFAPNFFVTDSSETDALRAMVDDDDCIEVFFVRDFSPVDLFGGGVTFGAGTASSKVISSDGNARGGIDFTHLAHELGHVLGLRHPDAAATASATPASTGTLMCPSGFLRDNPRVNSQENEDLVSNPLLVFAIKLRTPGPDCVDSADCGACP